MSTALNGRKPENVQYGFTNGELEVVFDQIIKEQTGLEVKVKVTFDSEDGTITVGPKNEEAISDDVYNTLYEAGFDLDGSFELRDKLLGVLFQTTDFMWAEGSGDKPEFFRILIEVPFEHFAKVLA